MLCVDDNVDVLDGDAVAVALALGSSLRVPVADGECNVEADALWVTVVVPER